MHVHIGMHTHTSACTHTQALCVGVGHLNLMLCTRAPLSKDEEYVSHDATVPALLERGRSGRTEHAQSAWAMVQNE